ncbi:MAG: fumarylacetoacetate hydrolase family protein [Pseudomonadota bacterium]|nr:fumarylacetoacetate hydrolase family protein [Pseudomonadota bacterium]
MMFDPNAFADQLLAEHDQGVRYHALLEVAKDPEGAYAIQDALIERLIARGAGQIVGWKIGLTTSAMQAMAGFSTPVAGAILASRAVSAGATVEASCYGRLGVESEVAVRLCATPPKEASEEVLFNCIDAVAAAFELIDDRGANYAILEACTLIADNSWNAGIVLGAAAPAVTIGQLKDVTGTLVRNGGPLGKGENPDALAVVAWLSEHLRGRGRRLEPGQWVLTGSVVRTEFASPGEHYQLTVGELPPVELTVG